MKKIGNYEIIGKIGEGGMAVVYKGRQISLNRPVAIKVLSKKLTEHKQIVERFNQEALIIAKLAHPNIIHIIDRGVINGMYYFVMDFIEGTDFAQIIKSGKYDTNKYVDVIIQVCKALSYAHKNGIIHRDIKPGNILIDSEGNTMVADFGIAQLFDQQTGGGQLTQDGAVLGTIAYMSPEQKVNSKNVTSATDIYSLGVVMYQMLTGTTPLGRFKLPSEINPKVSKPLENIILKCLGTDIEDRFKSAEEMKDRLLELLQGAHIQDNQKEKALQGIKSFQEKFALLDIIKETNFGAVYLFEKKENKEMMVIKKAKNQKKGLAGAKILSKLKHKSLVRIYGVSGDERLFIIVMEYISGGSLKDRLIQAHSGKAALRTCREISEGLLFAHQNKVIHGNLRPSNILISQKGEAKITDFGLEEHYTSGEDKTNWYFPSGESPSLSTDIFSAGVIFYEMFTGEIPKWQAEKLIPADNFKRLPLKVRMMITKMISLEQSDRYGDFGKIINVIDNILKPQKKKKGNKIFLMVLIISLLAVAFGLFFYLSGVFGQ